MRSSHGWSADGDRFEDARDIFEEVTLSREFPTFLTLSAYARYLTGARQPATAEEVAAAEPDSVCRAGTPSATGPTKSGAPAPATVNLRPTTPWVIRLRIGTQELSQPTRLRAESSKKHTIASEH
jgi:hypothetical protein